MVVDQVGEVTTRSSWISVSSDGEVTKAESIANATDHTRGHAPSDRAMKRTAVSQRTRRNTY